MNLNLAEKIVISLIKEAHTDAGVVLKVNCTTALIGSQRALDSMGLVQICIALEEKSQEEGFSFPTLIHNSAVVSESSEIGEGVVISPLTVIGPNTNLKTLVYANYHVGIGHDSQIGEYTQINPGAQIGGGVIIHSESLIGSNSTLLQSTLLNAPLTIGSGSIVLGKKNKAGTIAPIYSKYLPF